MNKLRLTFGLLCLCLMVNHLEASQTIIKNTPVSNKIKPPYNILLIISDQETYQLATAEGYALPAHEQLKRHGVTFRNHYTAAAMCTPSRATFLSGVPPQVNGVFDQMEYHYVPDLDPKRPNMGSILKELGYQTAYFGKFEMNYKILQDKSHVNYSTLLQPYGFDVFNPDGDVGSGPQEGYTGDPYIIGEAIRWLNTNTKPAHTNPAPAPFFMVVSLLNPHDIMYCDANIPGLPAAQKPLAPVILPPPDIPMYKKQWQFALPSTLDESLTAPGMPSALSEYQQGWAGGLGFIPTARKDMWNLYYNYYLNALRDNDRNLQQLVDALDAMDLWQNTVIIFTADHGEMGGAHGGLRGKGPMAYEQNSHIPLIIDHPQAPQGVSCSSLTSHIDLLPTLVGLTGLPKTRTEKLIKKFAGQDFSGLLFNPEKRDLQAVRPAVLFNYVGVSTIDGNTLLKTLINSLFLHKDPPALTEINLNKRGFLSFVFDGRYKFVRYYAPNTFNAPKTLEQILKYNDVQLFDLNKDPDERNNLAFNPKKNKDLILHMNKLLNDLMLKEVGVNDGKFLPAVIRPKTPPLTFSETKKTE